MVGIVRPFLSILGPKGRIRPNGIPRIDWTNPLTNGLVDYWWPLGDSGYINLITGDTTAKGSGTKNTLPLVTPTPYGTGPGTTTVTAFCQSRSFARLQAWAAPYSFACGFWQVANAVVNAAPGYIAICDGSSNDAFSIACASAGNVTWSYGNSGGQPTVAIANKAFHIVTGVATGSATQANYVDGVVQTAGTATSAFTGSSMNWVFGDTVANSGTNTSNTNAVIFFGAAWTRALNQLEVTLLWLDPYCFLIPPEAELSALFVSAAAPVVINSIGPRNIIRVIRRGFS